MDVSISREHEAAAERLGLGPSPSRGPTLLPQAPLRSCLASYYSPLTTHHSLLTPHP